MFNRKRTGTFFKEKLGTINTKIVTLQKLLCCIPQIALLPKKDGRGRKYLFLFMDSKYIVQIDIIILPVSGVIGLIHIFCVYSLNCFKTE